VSGICTDGASPAATLVQATNGDFYGTTAFGGNDVRSGGTVFKITPSGTLTTLYTFCSQIVGGQCTDGETPEAPLVQATNGDFYGTTEYGGTGVENGGTVFKIAPSGKLTTLINYTYEQPSSPFVQATDGNLYGTTLYDGEYGYGDVFKMTPRGAPTTLYSFCAQVSPQGYCTDGNYPSMFTTTARHTSGLV
jgi:uncharacterized repeat protein (TIGR03803 family)